MQVKGLKVNAGKTNLMVGGGGGGVVAMWSLQQAA